MAGALARRTATAPGATDAVAVPVDATVELRLVDGARPPRPAGSVPLTLLLGLVFATVLGVVGFQALRVQSEGRLDDIASRTAAEEARAKDLRRRLAEGAAPDRIAAVAAGQLGMVAPGDVTYLHADPPHDEQRAQYDPARDAPPPPPTTVPQAPTTTVPRPTTPSTTPRTSTPSTTVPRVTTPSTTTPARGTRTSSPSTTTPRPSTTTPTTVRNTPTTTPPTTRPAGTGGRGR